MIKSNLYKKISIASVVLISMSTNAQQVDFSFQNNNLPIEKRAEILVSQMTTEEKINQLKNGAAAIPRLKVPDYDWWNEALHGIGRNGKATIFPQAIALGATFDPKLAERVASAISTEARAKYSISQKNGNHSKYSGLTFWTPNINIFRDPRWGRGQETYGEDPYLTSRIGVAFVKGLQGNDPKYLKTEISTTISQAEQKVSRFKHKLEQRNVHEKIYEYCKAELLAENYFHSVFEAVKSIAETIREKSGLNLDGGILIDTAFSLNSPLIKINDLSTETKQSEHKGFANLIKGVFGMFRNTTAHSPKIIWEINENDALDIMSTISLIHRRLENKNGL